MIYPEFVDRYNEQYPTDPYLSGPDILDNMKVLIIILRWQYSASYQSIGKIMGISRQAVHYHWCRALSNQVHMTEAHRRWKEINDRHRTANNKPSKTNHH